MADMTADEAWDHVRDRLSPEERLRFDMGQDVTVEMTRDEFDAIKRDPMRRAIREGNGEEVEASAKPSTTPSPETQCNREHHGCRWSRHHFHCAVTCSLTPACTPSLRRHARSTDQ
jgi:hypothetical protein